MLTVSRKEQQTTLRALTDESNKHFMAQITIGSVDNKRPLQNTQVSSSPQMLQVAEVDYTGTQEAGDLSQVGTQENPEITINKNNAYGDWFLIGKQSSNIDSSHYKTTYTYGAYATSYLLRASTISLPIYMNPYVASGVPNTGTVSTTPQSTVTVTIDFSAVPTSSA